MESQQQILHYLASSFLFRGLNTNDLTQLAQKTKLHTYRPGYVLIDEGMISDKIFIILEGLIKVYRLTEDGKEVFLAFEKNNNYLGVMHLDDRPGTSTVETLQTTKMLMFHKKDLLSMLTKNPALWEKMYRIILEKMGEMKKIHSIRLGNDVYQRTYLLLEYLSQFTKDKTVMLSQEALANVVGATRPRVTEALHMLQNNKMILISPKKIMVL